jgi:predicted nuclease of predicted toxin-antitoxin system
VRVLLDNCVATSAKAVLLSDGDDVERVGDWPADPGDAAILAHATQHGSVVVTLDRTSANWLSSAAHPTAASSD